MRAFAIPSVLLRSALCSALGSLTCGLTCALTCGAPLSAQGRPALERVLTRWILAYERGRVVLQELAVKKGVVDAIYGRGWVRSAGGRDVTHRAALTTLLHAAADSRDPALTRVMLRLAAFGLLDDRATLRTPHFTVRRLANQALARSTRTASVFVLMRAAAGDFGGWRRRPRHPAGCRAAAILALGALGKSVVRPTLQKQLDSPEQIVRLAAAEALGRMQHPGALDDLGRAMRKETDPVVAQALVQSVHGVLARRGKDVDQRTRARIVQSALGLLGRAGWRADLEVVELFEQLRSAAVVPALIELLERHAAAATATAQVSPRVLQAVQRTLRSLTGAIVEPTGAGWRAYWEGVKDSFVVAKPKPIAATRTKAGFFGLPVVGRNVVFVIDTSGSMKAQFFRKGDFDPESDARTTRLAVAKRELLEAVAGLVPGARFNLVSFASSVTEWKRALVQVDRNTKAALRRHVKTLVAGGATNLFGALEAALKIKTIRYGARYDVPVDEVFLLSDGEPTAGTVKEAVTILQLIRATNRYSKVRIHTVYMGGGGDSVFMRQLAEQNGGQYVRL